MPGPESGPMGHEQEKSIERTRESEIGANVEFWRNFGVEVDESVVRETIEALPEREGYDWYMFIPEGVKTSAVFEKMKESFTAENFLGDLDKIRMPRTATEAYAVAARYSQEPDEDSLKSHSKKNEEWENSGENFMTPLERMVAELRWYQENGNHLDEQNMTVCPGTRLRHEKAPFWVRGDSDYWDRTTGMHFDPSRNEVSIFGAPPKGGNPNAGVRRVVTKETKVG